MKWTDDPKEPWIAIYRVVMMILMIVSVVMSARAHRQIELNRATINSVVPTVAAVASEGRP